MSTKKYASPEAELPGDLAAARIIRPGQAAAIRGVTTSTLYRMVRAGRLPAPRRLSHRVSGWPAGEILPLLTSDRTAA